MPHVSLNRAVVPILAACAVLAAGCGVQFGSSEKGTEFFTDLEVSGKLEPGQPLTAFLSFEQFYPVEVTLSCELRQKKTTIREIGREEVPRLPEGSPERTPYPGHYSFDFTVDQTGTFKIECLTPLDEDNFIVDEFTIREPADGTVPTPTITPLS